MNKNKEYVINRYRLVDQAYNIIKSLIFSGEICSGEEVSVDGLARKLGISKTPVREALNKLIGEGLMVTTGKNKIKIIELTLEEISNICDLRNVLEVLALKEGFLKISREKLLENLKMIKECKKDLENGKTKKYHTTDNILHEMIIDSTDNKWLIQTIMQLRNLIDIVRLSYPSLDRFKIAIDEHINIIEAITSEDKENSLKNLTLHLENIKNRTIDAFNNKNKNTPANSKE
ncbi:MAG: GntR family transcriptional regulator [Actinobacteria bacterium]|nr:GntR family transcriptional regulator [Actinomycetota bacterium]